MKYLINGFRMRKLNMKNRTNTRWLTQLALLVAVLLVMNYTPLGYLQIGPLSASLLTVPVAIGAMTIFPRSIEATLSRA